MSARSGRLYAESPFRVLGLPPTASDLEIRRRAKELRLRAEVDGAAAGVIDLIRFAEDDTARTRTREDTKARRIEYRRTRTETTGHQRTRHTAGS